MSSSIVSPFPVFNDLDGTPLEAGYIFIGTSNLNPEVSPINVFWDDALTVPAAQPIRTIGGYPSRNGSPGNMYVSADTYSITVRNRNQVFVFAAFNQPYAPPDVFNVSQEVITATVAQQTVFTLRTINYLPGTNTLSVYRNGIRLLVGLDYLETNSTTITLTRGIAIGNQLLLESRRIVTENISAIATSAETQSATAGQTFFTLATVTYVPGNNGLTVYRNGLKLIVGVDYAETSSNAVTLTSPAALNDQLEFNAGKMLTNTLAGTSVGFLQAGTGAITRNMQDKARESVSVKDFGAVGDGTTDDSSAFIAAINSLSSSGGSIIVPTGVYYLTSSTLASASNLPPAAFGSKSIYWNISSGAVFNGTVKFPNMTTNNNCLSNGPYAYQQKTSAASGTIDATFSAAFESIQPASATNKGYGALYLGAQLNASGETSINSALNAVATANAGSSGNIWGIEIDVANLGPSNTGTQFGLSINGYGGNDVTFGIKLDRADGVSKYLYGLAIRNSRIGIYVEPTSGTENVAIFGLPPTRYPGNLIQASQFNNTGSVLLLNRFTNTSPGGYFINALDASAVSPSQIFSVQTDGAVYSKNYTMYGNALPVGAGFTSIGNGITTSASVGAATLPANPRGFIKGYAEGVEIRIPYYNA
jgi:hypothetical protein